MRNRILAAAILLLPFSLFLFFWLHPVAEKTATVGDPQASQTPALARELAAVPAPTTALIASNFAQPPQSAYYSPPLPAATVAPARTPTLLEVTNIPPQIVLENMRRAIRDYGALYGGNPVGINSEITRQLTGDNPKHLNFLRPEAGMRVNDRGELIDPWGTPYFFHQLSGTDMEIHSAGPDRALWTADDLVTR